MHRQRLTMIIGFMIITIFLIFPVSIPAADHNDPKSITRISPEAAKEKLDSGKALMVCSYEDQRCGEMMINGAITRSELDRRKPSLAKGQELIFYCG